MKQSRRRSNIKPQPILLLFILISNTAIVAHWYFGRPEEVSSIIKDEVEIPVRKGAVIGYLARIDRKDNIHVEFVGWAFDSRNYRLPDTILLTYDWENVYSGQTHFNRQGVAGLYGDKALTSGFRFVLPLTMFKNKKIDNSKVRFFAVSNGVASELNYFKGFK